jgi:hypothetical protein
MVGYTILPTVPLGSPGDVESLEIWSAMRSWQRPYVDVTIQSPPESCIGSEKLPGT